MAVLGATGSIGQSTLDVVARHPSRYRATVLSANRSVTEMAALCRDHRPKHAVMADDSAAEALREMLAGLPEVEVSAGSEVLDKLVAAPEIDTVVAGIVGFAGLQPTLSAARSGKTILLANKEALVSAGGFSWQRFGRVAPRYFLWTASTMRCTNASRLTLRAPRHGSC